MGTVAIVDGAKTERDAIDIWYAVGLERYVVGAFTRSFH